jgi:hypothetical protein
MLVWSAGDVGEGRCAAACARLEGVAPERIDWAQPHTGFDWARRFDETVTPIMYEDAAVA